MILQCRHQWLLRTKERGTDVVLNGLKDIKERNMTYSLGYLFCTDDGLDNLPERLNQQKIKQFQGNKWDEVGGICHRVWRFKSRDGSLKFEDNGFI